MHRSVLSLIWCLYSCSLVGQTEMAESLRSNVVAISAQGQSGFGFITGERGGKLFIATASHVVEAALAENEPVVLKFFNDYRAYRGNIIRNYPDVDVALVEVDVPASFSWESNCLGVATPKAKVAFIGREGEWYVPAGGALGDIYSLTNNQVQADITSIRVGTSGAPLIVESGIVGLIVYTDGQKATAVDLNQLRAVLSEYDYFFQLTGAGLLETAGADDLDTEAIYKDIRAFKAAQNRDDIPAYQSYIRDFPSGEFRDKAIARIQELEAEKAAQQETARWEVAKVRDDEAGYRKYLSDYPNGTYADLARQRLAALQRASKTAEVFVTDRHGNTYSAKVLKDGKRWMTQNLNLQVDDSWCYENKADNCDTYGRLYTWEAAKEACAELGDGWRLPTDDEWREMAKKYGGADDDASDGGKAAYEALIEGGSSGFAAQLGGFRGASVSFLYAGAYGFYWSRSPSGSSYAWYYSFHRGNGGLYRLDYHRGLGRSVRCLQGSN